MRVAETWLFGPGQTTEGMWSMGKARKAIKCLPASFFPFSPVSRYSALCSLPTGFWILTSDSFSTKARSSELHFFRASLAASVDSISYIQLSIPPDKVLARLKPFRAKIRLPR